MGCSGCSSPKMDPSNQDCERAGAWHQVPLLSPGSAARGGRPRALSFLGWRAGGSVPSPGWEDGGATGAGTGKSHSGISGPEEMPRRVWWTELIKMSRKAPGHFLRRNHQVLKDWLMKLRNGKHESGPEFKPREEHLKIRSILFCSCFSSERG